MNGKRKLMALLLTFAFLAHATALAGGAPSSQFGFKGLALPSEQQLHINLPQRDSSRDACADRGPHTGAHCDACADRGPHAAAHRDACADRGPHAAAHRDACADRGPHAEPTVTPAPTEVPTPEPTVTPSETEVPPFTDEDYTTGSITAQEENAFLLLNQDRAANGRSALELDPRCATLARLKSRDMYLNNYFSHTSPTYGSAAQMLSTYGYSFTSVGEKHRPSCHGGEGSGRFHEQFRP